MRGRLGQTGLAGNTRNAHRTVNDEGGDQRDNRAPFQEVDEARVVADVVRDVLGRRIDQNRLVFGHDGPRLC